MKIKNAIFSVLILFTISVSCQQSNEILLDSDSSIKAEELRRNYIFTHLMSLVAGVPLVLVKTYSRGVFNQSL